MPQAKERWVFADGEDSRILRLESKLSDLRMENANQLTCEASDRSEVGAFLYQNKKPTTRVGFLISANLGGSWLFADGEDSRILRLESKLSDLRMENANQLT